MTNLKLQKLLYYSQAWHLALFSLEIFAEDFQAWVHGPVLPSQYQRFAEFKWRPITDNIAQPDVQGEVKAHLLEVVDVFGSETAGALELMTHRELPWLEARGNIPSDRPSTALVRKETMLRFYRDLAHTMESPRFAPW